MRMLPERFPIGFEFHEEIIHIMGDPLSMALAKLGNICVGTFLFLAGYGMYYKIDLNKFGGVEPFKSIKILYISFWKVFLIFIPLGYLCFSTDIVYAERSSQCFNFTNFSLKNIVSDFLAYTNYHNGEWWFMRAYMFGIIFVYVYYEITKKINSFLVEIAIIGAIQFINKILCSDILFRQFNLLSDDIIYALWKNMQWSKVLPGIILLGYIFGKYDMLSKISYQLYHNMQTSIRFLFIIVSEIVLIYSRYIFEGTGMDFLLVPVFLVISKALLDYLPGFAYICKFIGKHSTNMWLVHTFFCYYFYYVVKIVYCTPNAYIDWAILVALTLSSSLLIDLFWKWILTIYHIIAVQKMTA